jgi:deazaflavin-dependent oxidoreductase (nitroreductase family)
MPDPNATAWEDQLIAEMRANGGEVRNGPLAGHPLLIMTSRGAKSGESRRAVLTYHKDGKDFVVAGTASGSPKTPGWVYNIEADPDVTIEVGNEEVGATASVVADGAERDRLWNDHVGRLPWFADYPKQTGGRVIPMVRLTPKAA